MLTLDNVITVAVPKNLIGLKNYKVNNVAYFTTEVPIAGAAAAGYIPYVSAAQVGVDFGTGTVTYAVAVAFFSQAPNVLNAGGQFIVAPIASSTLALADINTLASKIFFTGILASAYAANSTWKTLADSVQALGDKVLLIPTATYSDVAGAATDIKNALDSRTRVLFRSDSLANALLYAAAYAGSGFAVDYSASNSTITMNLGQLVTILPDEGITQAYHDACMTAGVDTYCDIAGVPAVQSSGANDFFDNVLNLVWFVSALKVAGFNALAQVSSKVPQTEMGVGMLKSAYRAICQQAVNNAYLAPGAWTSADTFGVQADFFSNIQGFGFYLYSVPVSAQSTADRVARKAPTIMIAAKLAGAIHNSNVIVALNS